MTQTLISISEAVYSGVVEAEIKKLTQKAVDEGIQVQEILENGLINGLNKIGTEWKNEQAFIPEVIRSSKTMKFGMEVIRELIIKSDIKPIAKVVIGTVKGDVHDIGKSLVSMMLEAFGFQVYDLGIDISPEKFIEAAKEYEPKIICMSALLTTTMPEMGLTVQAIKEEGLNIKTMIGGAPTSEEFCNEIESDGWAPDAVSAMEKAKELINLEK